jgi:hypothetical protein
LIVYIYIIVALMTDDDVILTTISWCFSIELRLYTLTIDV